MICECCVIHQAHAVASMPSVPISVAFCLPCLAVGNYPLWALLANTACVGRLEDTAEDWQDMVRRSCAYQGKSLEWFSAEVGRIVSKMEREMYENNDTLALKQDNWGC